MYPTYRCYIIDATKDRNIQFFSQDLTQLKDELKERLKQCSALAIYEIHQTIETVIERGDNQMRPLEIAK